MRRTSVVVSVLLLYQSLVASVLDALALSFKQSPHKHSPLVFLQSSNDPNAVQPSPTNIAVQTTTVGTGTAPCSTSPEALAATEAPTDQTEDEEDLWAEMSGDEQQYASGDHFEWVVEQRRKKAKHRKWIAAQLANNYGNNVTALEHFEQPSESTHPVKGLRHPLLWKYQFGTIVFVLAAMYGIQVLIDYKGRKAFSLYTRPSTCLMLGANFRGLGETKLVSAARFVTCAFLHAHVFHLFSNALSIYAAWIFFSIGAGKKVPHVWVYHWTFPIFFLTAVLGSFYSYQTTLKYSGFSIGASGGCLGLSTAFLFLAVRFEGVPRGTGLHLLLTIVSIVFSCVPWDSLFSGESGSTDLGAHAAGALGGVFAALILSNVPSGPNGVTLVDSGDIFSCTLLVVLLLAYAEVAREYVVDGRELLVRAYVKWLGMSGDEQPCIRRLTAPGRLQCELLTEEYLYLLDTEKIEDDAETILKRLEEENKYRRKTAPDLGGFVY